MKRKMLVYMICFSLLFSGVLITAESGAVERDESIEEVIEVPTILEIDSPDLRAAVSRISSKRKRLSSFSSIMGPSFCSLSIIYLQQKRNKMELYMGFPQISI